MIPGTWRFTDDIFSDGKSTDHRDGSVIIGPSGNYKFPC